ncbi:type VI secretion system baseplate subunit TssG [Jiella sp. CQZ9-1]|uniref:Type VI secretion system baseplate subunit TssG n=2 Tax=Jiella flava TaxID=2816857 RepID=A0A939FXG0_9HYPH|nr:type VI secretion system baseplate subunit TssG [Jiella flava]
MLRQRLANDPGRFEFTTAFRVATEDPAVRVTSTFGVRPAAVAVTIGTERGGDRVAATPAGGLIGSLGVLPPSYDEAVMREERNRSHALRSFVDLFTARITALLVGAAEKYRLARRLRWAEAGGKTGNAFLKTLFSLTGFNSERLRTESRIDPDILLRYSGFFAQRIRNAASLQAMLAEVTGVPVRIEQFRPRWLTIADSDRTAIDGRSQLGVDTIAGASIKDHSSGFRIVLGPLGYDDYLAFAPGKPDAAALVALTQLFVGSGLTFDVQMVLKKDEIPLCQLGSQGPAAPRLGWNSWARVAPAVADSGDAFYPAEVGSREATHAA